jgi:glycosyltransferase involved in cell wall biosynthesis
MYKGNTISVVIPCFDEESQIGKVLESVPEYVDYIIAVDDASEDGTKKIINNYMKSNTKIIIYSHKINRGVGASIQTGYEISLNLDADIAYVVAGDNQMDQSEAYLLLDPIIESNYSYTKANRIYDLSTISKIPKTRLIGNLILSILTRFATGYWLVGDSQTGFTAITKSALKIILSKPLYPRYGVPNDILIRLSHHGLRVKDVPLKPIYDVGEKTKLFPRKVAVPIFFILVKGFFSRMFYTHLVRYSSLVPFGYLAVLVSSASLFIYLIRILIYFSIWNLQTNQIIVILVLTSSTLIFFMLTMILDMLFEFNRIAK